MAAVEIDVGLHDGALFDGIDVGSYALGTTLTASNAINIDGQGGGGTTSNRGIHQQGSTLSSGNGVSLTGNGGSGSSYNDGVYLNATDIDGGSGATTVIGNANAATTGYYNMGISVLSASNIVGTTLTMTGTGGGGSTGNRGLSIIGSTTRASSGPAILSGTALGATSGLNNAGVYKSGATIGGTAIDVNGIGGGGSGYNHGIYMNAIGLFAGSGAVNSDDATAGVGVTSKDKTGNFFPV